jgi:hypothetical protein
MYSSRPARRQTSSAGAWISIVWNTRSIDLLV